MKKLIMIAVVVAVLVGSGGFYGGMKYSQGRGGARGNFANLTPEQRQQAMANGGVGFRGGAGQGRGGMPGQGMNGGFMAGEIISQDDKSITIKMGESGSKIIFYSDTTEISKFTDGTVGDLIVGKNVSVTGTANQDGSLTAKSIQIRPVPTAASVK